MVGPFVMPAGTRCSLPFLGASVNKNHSKAETFLEGQKKMGEKIVEMSADQPSVGNVPEGEGEAFIPNYAKLAKFSMDEWLQGVRPIKRTVTLYQRLDMLATRDELAAELDLVKYTDEGAARKIRGQIREVTDEIMASRMFLTLQGLTITRFREVLDEIEARDYGDNPALAMFDQWASQVAEPAGITGEWLQQFNEGSPIQAHKIQTALNQINNAVPDVEATVPL